MLHDKINKPLGSSSKSGYDLNQQMLSIDIDVRIIKRSEMISCKSFFAK